MQSIRAMYSTELWCAYLQGAQITMFGKNSQVFCPKF